MADTPGVSNQDQIIRASGTVSIASAAMYLFWYARESIVAARLGVSAEMDAFVAAYSIPFFLSAVLSGLAQTVMIPGYVEAKVDSDARLARYRNRAFTWTVLLVTALTVGLAISVPWVARLVAPESGGGQLDRVMRLLWVMLPLPAFGTLAAVAAAFLIAEKRLFSANVIAVISSGIPAALVWFRADRWGVWSFAAGLTIGWAVQMAVAMVLLYRAGVRLAFTHHLAARRCVQIVTGALPLGIGVLGTALVPIIDRAMASGLPTGSLSALGYAERFQSIVLAFFTAVQTAVFPYFSEQVSRRNVAGLRIDVLSTISLALFVAIPGSALLAMFGVPLIGLLFGRGAFDAAAVDLTGTVLMAYSVGIAAAVTGNVAARVINAYQDWRTIGVLGVLNPILKIAFNALLLPLGAVGLALSFSAMTAMTTLLVLGAVSRRLGRFVEPWFWRALAKQALAIAAMWLLVQAVRGATSWAGYPSFWPAEALAGLAAFTAACWLMRLQLTADGRVGFPVARRT